MVFDKDRVNHLAIGVNVMVFEPVRNGMFPDVKALFSDVQHKNSDVNQLYSDVIA